jgi:hypothetical protein
LFSLTFIFMFYFQYYAHLLSFSYSTFSLTTIQVLSSNHKSNSYNIFTWRSTRKSHTIVKIPTMCCHQIQQVW